MSSATINCPEPQNAQPSGPADNYAALLRPFELNFKATGYHFQVGETQATQGWIIHLSAVLSQTVPLIEAIIPYLIDKDLAFKIPLGHAIAEDILNGTLGITEIGKIVTIYPEPALQTIQVAKDLLSLTKSFKGPAVPTDSLLGGIVYTRYGSFRPIMKLGPDGIRRKYFYDKAGLLTEDCQTIPFRLPAGTTWPFDEISRVNIAEPPKPPGHLFKITGILKQDPRGNVYKALYLKNLLNVKKCVIKQGISNMASDPEGRDIQDRLRWQSELHQRLCNRISLPKPYHLHSAQGAIMFIMEYIPGCSLFEKLLAINPSSGTWTELSGTQRAKILKYAIQIAKSINILRESGYIHRDINPVNFLVDKKDRIVLIDLELAYSIRDDRPSPPFRQGTPGFMSPQQARFSQPTLYDDIYSLGATLLFMFTGLLPVQCDTKSANQLAASLYALIGNQSLAAIISDCFTTEGQDRPAINTIIQTLETCYRETQTARRPGIRAAGGKLSVSELDEVIASAIQGLTQQPIPILHNLWLSKQLTAENLPAPQIKRYAANPGTAEGVSGVVYALARISKAGTCIDSCRDQYAEGWRFLLEACSDDCRPLPGGLYNGKAGIAMSLAEGISSGLVSGTAALTNLTGKLLDSKPEGFSLATGVAGQGVSILSCTRLLKTDAFDHLLEKRVDDLLGEQRKDGSWFAVPDATRSHGEWMDAAFDQTGPGLFLTKYLAFRPNPRVEKALTHAISRKVRNKSFLKHFYHTLASKAGYNIGDGGKGFLLLLIKAYELFNDKVYKEIATAALATLPRFLLHPNFTTQNGLAAMGELYLEAFRVFKTAEWKTRADWIANVFCHTIIRNPDGSGYWVLEQNNPPTADLLTSITGIIHFLSRCAHPAEPGYRIID
ncbi:MAG TPA: protein kinase [Puia sp.]|nr:protein kinase [Puia sp.]